MSRHLDSSTTTQIWSSMEDPVVPLERNLYGHPLAGLLWERQFEKILLKHGWEKIPNWECLFVHREKGLFLSVYVDAIYLAGKKQNLDPMWKLQRSRFGRTNIFPGSCILGMHSKPNKQRYCGQLQNHIRIANLSGWNRKTSIHSKSSYFFMVLCQQYDSTTLQSIHSMHRWRPLQRRRNEICWRIVTSIFSNCSEMLILGKNWTTWYSMVSE